MMIGGADEAVKRLDPIFAALAPGRGEIPRTPGSRERRRHGGAGLSSLRAERRGPLRQDGAQRHRVRDHGGLCRGLQRSAQRERRQREAGRERRDDAAARSGALQYDLNLPDIAEVWRRGSVIASWLLDLTAAALTRGSAAREVRGQGLRFGRGTLDRQGGDRRRRAGSGADRGALRAIRLARQRRVCQSGSLGDALRVRRAPRAKVDGPSGCSR